MSRTAPPPRTPPTVAPVALTLTALARRWRVDVETARRVLRGRGVPAQRTHATPRYLRRDVLAVERAGALAGVAWPDASAPLLTTDEVGAALDIDASTARRYAAAGRVAATRLGPRLLRFHPDLAPTTAAAESAS